MERGGGQGKSGAEKSACEWGQLTVFFQSQYLNFLKTYFLLRGKAIVSFCLDLHALGSKSSWDSSPFLRVVLKISRVGVLLADCLSLPNQQTTSREDKGAGIPSSWSLGEGWLAFTSLLETQKKEQSPTFVSR